MACGVTRIAAHEWPIGPAFLAANTANGSHGLFGLTRSSLGHDLGSPVALKVKSPYVYKCHLHCISNKPLVCWFLDTLLPLLLYDHSMNYMKLVIPLHFISRKKTPNDAVTPKRQSQFTPKMKANAAQRLLSSLV